ncbi:MAG: four helix bundle protein [Melioribacter sp.]|nr:four helix bundle protein [Melioribacter sp.]
MNNHKDLEVWKQSIEFVKDIYERTKSFPKEELFGITNQIRRSAVSIPSNIAEGAARNHKGEFKQFLYISLGSLSELETQLIITREIKYLDDNQFVLLNEKLETVRKLLIGLIKFLKK